MACRQSAPDRKDERYLIWVFLVAALLTAIFNVETFDIRDSFLAALFEGLLPGTGVR